jgi:cytochrome c oxidase accessory protein FixG
MHLFLAYFVSIPEVWSMMHDAPSAHVGAFAFMAISTAILYFNFAWFREQLCIVLCPYGRLQSVLIDNDTLVIGYDAKRGEPRGKAGVAQGDCVDCLRCVHVCPTGIDIRQGLQLECIGCTACIDACDDVMTRMGRARGLVRYDSPAAFTGRKTRWFRARTLLYFVFLLAGAGVAGWAISTIKPATFGVTRMVGAPYIVDSAQVRNQFLIRVVNKRNTPATYLLQLANVPPGTQQIGFDRPVEIGPLGEIVQPLIVQEPRGAYTGPFHFSIRINDAANTYHLQREVEFLGPEARLLREEENEHHDAAVGHDH